MKIVWSRRALRCLAGLRDYIEKDNPKAARQVAMRIVEGAERLAEQPNMGRQGRIAGTRELVIPGTPYIIPYRVRGERLELVAIFHGRQKWPKRPSN